MKNYIYILLLSIVGLIAGCTKIEDPAPSTPGTVSLPEVVEQYANGSYGFGLGSGKIYQTIPDTIALVVDTAVGFTGGFGGKTGHDFAYLLKSDVKGGWPDTTQLGGASLIFEKYNTNNYKVQVIVNIVVAEPIKSPQKPGPTSLEGSYKRSSNGFIIKIVKIFDGVYLIDNLGGAGVAPYPFVLKNFTNTSGKDSLSFEIQPNSCGGGAQLIDPTSGPGLTATEYAKTYPPSIVSLAPVTFKWIVMEFPDATPESVGAAGLCQWGGAVRTFVKQ